MIDEQGWSELYSQEIAQCVICIDFCSDLFAVYVRFELIKIEADRSRVRFEQFARVRSLAPGCLFPIQHIVHLPKTALQPGCFCGHRRFTSVFVSRQRKIPKHEAQTGIVFFQELLSKTGEIATGRALKIGKLFQRHRGIGIAPHVH